MDAEKLIGELYLLYPDAGCTLNYKTPFELLLATVLSAQCTDKRVNMVTPELFARCPTPAKLGAASTDEIEQVIHSLGFFRQKAKSLQGIGRMLSQSGGQVPQTPAELILLPGVGPKTANVVMGNAFGIASGFVVDTHVKRLARRLGQSSAPTVARIAVDLEQRFDPGLWIKLSHQLILHGRALCRARRPLCADCSLVFFCPQIGVANG